MVNKSSSLFSEEGFTLPLKRRAGFTIFELIIIVTIIGLLIAIGIPSYISMRTRAMREMCISNQRVIYTAAVIYTFNESDSLEGKTDKERLDALVNKGYIRGSNKWCECPSSSDGDYDDYIIIIENDFISDVVCDEKGDEHKWP